MRTMHNFLQQISHLDVWQKIPKPGKQLEGTGVAMSGLFKIDPHIQEQKVSWEWMCFLITGFAAEIRSGDYGFGRDIKVSIVFKAVSAVNETVSMD